MKFLLDENIPLSTVKTLEGLGCVALHVRLCGLRGASDEEVAMYAKKQQAVLLTKDLEFGSLLLYPPGSHYGLLIVRVPSFFKTEQMNELLKSFLVTIRPEELTNAITILQVGKYRIRKMQGSVHFKAKDNEALKKFK